MPACSYHKNRPFVGYHRCVGCELESMKREIERIKEDRDQQYDMKVMAREQRDKSCARERSYALLINNIIESVDNQTADHIKSELRKMKKNSDLWIMVVC